MYLVTVEKSLSLVRVVCEGFLSVEELLVTGRHMRAEIARLRPFTNGVNAIVICSPIVQSAEVVTAAHGDKWTMPHPNDRLAIAVPSALVKLQITRTFTTDRERNFRSEDEARAWLMADATGTRLQAARA